MAGDISYPALEKALDEFEALLALPRQIEDDDITAPRVAKRLGKRSQNIKPTLEQMVRVGKMVCVGKVQQEDGRLVTAYKLVKAG